MAAAAQLTASICSIPANASLTSGSRLVAWPVVGFGCRIAGPATDGVIEAHGGLELLEGIAIDARITERRCEQPSGLRRQIKTSGVSPKRFAGLFPGLADDCRAPGSPISRESCCVLVTVVAGIASPPLSGCVDAIFQPQPHGVIADDPLAALMPRPSSRSKGVARQSRRCDDRTWRACTAAGQDQAERPHVFAWCAVIKPLFPERPLLPVGSVPDPSPLASTLVWLMAALEASAS